MNGDEDPFEDIPLFRPRAIVAPGESLASARELFQSLLRDGTHCPCCDRFGKIYRRKLNSAMARTLILMYLHERDHPGWIHMISVGNFGLPSRDYGTLQHWGLTEAKEGAKEDGNPEPGYHRLTDLGKAFVRGENSVKKYVYLYNDQEIEVDEPEAGERINVREALGSRFDYQDMMQG